LTILFFLLLILVWLVIICHICGRIQFATTTLIINR